MSQAKIWYYVFEGKADGPHTLEEIKESLKTQKLTYSDLVFRPGLSRWIPIGECKEFERRDDVSKESNERNLKLKVPPADEALQNSWVILIKQSGEDGKNHYIQSGPYSTDSVHRKIRKGELKYTDYLWKKGFKTWQIVNSIPEFERRGKEEAPVPKPLHAMAATAITPPEALVPKESTEGNNQATVVFSPPKTAKVPDEVIVEQLKEQIESEDDFVEEDLKKIKFSFNLKGKINPKKAMIAGIGATLGVALMYAALSAYNENQSVPEQRSTASVRPVAKPVNAQPPVAHLPVTQAVNPELENRVPKKPSALKIVSLKMSSDHPQVVLESDLPGGTLLDIEVTASSGSILKYPSFEMSKKVTVKDGQLPSIDFSQDKLPPGDYKMVVKGGGLETTSPFSVGEHDSEFQKRLAIFRSKIAIQRKKEKAGLEDGVKFVTRSYSSLNSTYKSTHSSLAQPNSAQGAKKRWMTMLKNWRKEYLKQSSMLEKVEIKNKNYFVYPDALLKLKAVEEQLNDVTQLYDKSLKTGRSIASESDMNSVFLDHVKDLKETVRRIK